MITYREFRNSDPPRILELWNLQAARSRGFGFLSGCDNLEQLIFSKPYFDRKGLILAFDGDRLVGMCHAGFGCTDDESALDTSRGVICTLIVHPDSRRQGIGSELFERAIAYVAERGTTDVQIGPLHPYNPFYLGLYGGSETPGILDSDQEMVEFVRKRGFAPWASSVIYQVGLDDLIKVEDHRLPLLRRRVEIQAEPLPMPHSWWDACINGPTFSLRYEMVDRDTQLVIGSAWVWQMDSFTRNWDMSAVGMTKFAVAEGYRRQGFGKLLLFSILKHIKEHEIGLVEAQTMEDNEPARRLYESVGFQIVDVGRIYRKTTPSMPNAESLE